MPAVHIECRGSQAGIGSCAETGRGRQRQCVLRQQGGREVAGVDDRAEVDAELLQQGALHLGDGDLQHHLLLALDGEQVDDELAVAAAGRRLALRLLPIQVRALRGRCLFVAETVGGAAGLGLGRGRAGPTSLLAATNWQAMSWRALGIERRAHASRSGHGAAGHLGPGCWSPASGASGCRRARSRSAPTEISSVRICWPLVSKKKALVWPSFLAIRKTRLEACTTASTVVGIGDQHVLQLERKLHQQRLAACRARRAWPWGNRPRAGILSAPNAARSSSTYSASAGRRRHARLATPPTTPMVASSNAPGHPASKSFRMVCQPSCRP